LEKQQLDDGRPRGRHIYERKAAKGKVKNSRIGDRSEILNPMWLFLLQFWQEL
jgi:uncharacterized membrane protein YccF (DUF307 family)